MSELKEDKNLYNMPIINWKEFACGWGAGIVNISVVYPVNKMLFRQMLHGVCAKSAISQLKSEGLQYLYRGILPPMCQKALSISLMFGVYEEVRRHLLDCNTDENLATYMGGFFSGASEGVLLPFERIQALLCDANYHDKFKNMAHASAVIRQRYGFAEYYRGMIPFLLRNIPTNMLFFIGKDEVQKTIPQIQSPVLRTLVEFTYGALIGTVLSCVFYPVSVVKITMQSKLGGDFENTFIVLKRIYYERGSKIRYIYQGTTTNLMRAFISWGIMNASYESIKMIVDGT